MTSEQGPSSGHCSRPGWPGRPADRESDSREPYRLQDPPEDRLRAHHGSSRSDRVGVRRVQHGPIREPDEPVNIELVGKIDANTGPAGTFTGKEHWPAMAPSDLKFAKGDNVVLTIKE